MPLVFEKFSYVLVNLLNLIEVIDTKRRETNISFRMIGLEKLAFTAHDL